MKLANTKILYNIIWHSNNISNYITLESNLKNEMANNCLEWNGIIWGEIELFGIKINEKECSRSVPLHRQDIR